jgi:uncharacterized glyoxalase superfamily protein PhnB
MAKATSPIPPGYHTITAHLAVKGAEKFMEFVKKAFGAVEIARSPGPDGRWMHALVRIGDSLLMFNDDFPEMAGTPLAEGRHPLVLHLYVPDADAAFAQAVAAGCTVRFPLADQFWGDRYGHVQDPFGFVWGIATHKEDLTPAEIEERMQKAMAHGKCE